jgi:exodeoxyribonuclease-3
MRIYSWNVNGLRACHGKGFCDWLARCDGSLVAVQEVRAAEGQLPDEVRHAPGWHTHFHAAQKPGYSGVGLFSRQPWAEVSIATGESRFDDEGRLQFASFGPLLVVNGYFPNGNGVQRDLSRIPYKLDFYRKVFDRLAGDFATGRPIVVLGDFNTAPEAIDLARPKANEDTSGFRPEERAEVRRWLDAGWVDSFRHAQPGAEGAYSWWSQRFGVRGKNIGWRIDLALVSPGALPFLRGAAIHPEVKGSDHCPISLDLDDAVLAIR